jgi:hypothetical protein
MARVADLEAARVEALAAELVPVLRDRGAIVVDVERLDSVERWRRAARRAGRLLGWHMRTGLSRDGRRVWAATDDWPVPSA